MSEDLQRFLEAALATVKTAEPIFRQSFGKAAGAVAKDDQYRSPVTDADKEIEKVIAEELSRRFPEHSVSGEEFPPRRKSGPYTWYIDPIDGTVNYIRGLPFASISLGLWRGETPLLGVVSDPVTGVFYSAARGDGAFKNATKRLSVSRVSRLKDAMGVIGRNKAIADEAALQRLARAAHRGRGFGGGALELCLLAEGKLDFLVSENLKIYDFAAGVVIVAEAGGKAGDWRGGAFDSRASTLAASNGSLHGELVDTLSGR